MKKTTTFVRYKGLNNEIKYGVLEDNDILELSSSFSDIVNDRVEYEGSSIKYKDAKILAPVVPSKIINFGWTYSEHAIETGGQANLKEPFLFLKPSSSIIPHQGTIILPPTKTSTQIEMEGEVALIIGKRGKNVKQEEALDYVFGCTIFNDVTARDLTQRDPQFTRGKGFDTFGPLGPCIVTGVDPTNLNICTRLNGEIVQIGNTSEMTLSIPYLISWISEIMTLEPGDILATGSPSGSCPMSSGDVVEVKVEKIGSLCNDVVRVEIEN
ncbi:fumarylacetoacetate hydrolase family protein [Alkalihalophilus marmarensis]|uniref:fumarylacetoacetate hydrolase family protein n=1 Tax=Alkalihalophilus marmarensis TaxID=521377 RepID=UPI002E24DE25|nr:fumarylacetoacetate hydrolase family protein [Alkalihalophilus marmarensis]MED1603181.1 fumarylacetoacetate hydrolase family protein [Alkalihalophilus marmarensis]